MYPKVIFLLTLLFGLSAASIAAVRPHLPVNIRTSLKITTLTGEPLIKAACQGIGDNETDCLSVLHAAPAEQKAGANSLALYTLRYIENHAEVMVAGIKNFSTVLDVAPMLQSALTDCTEQYTSIDDLIETAASSVEEGNYAEAEQFIIAAVASIDTCGNQLNASSDEERAEDLNGPSVNMEKDLKTYNLLHRNLLLAVLNIITI